MIRRSNRYAVDSSTGERMNNIRYVRGRPYNDFEAEIQEDQLFYAPKKINAFRNWQAWFQRAIKF